MWSVCICVPSLAELSFSSGEYVTRVLRSQPENMQRIKKNFSFYLEHEQQTNDFGALVMQTQYTNDTTDDTHHSLSN